MNVIPTLLLLLIQCYWIVVTLGFFDLEFMDIDVDLESAEGIGFLNSLALFVNYGNVPFGLVLSLIILNFWILMMLTYYLPIQAGGIISFILLFPAFLASLYITKFEVQPLKARYFEQKENNDIEHRVLNKRCQLLCSLEYGRLGQAEINQDGVSIVINVKSHFEGISFEKGEYALVLKKDDKDIYYIGKLLLGNDFYKEMEEV
ncbi:hypothetical protein [Fusibacter sp. JL216-2]|uniref:hypothetical protein n=1 Tax=Fusibacter sp. JL216-2 TaxID=3071453 RepID=UPI003D332875